MVDVPMKSIKSLSANPRYLNVMSEMLLKVAHFALGSGESRWFGLAQNDAID